MELCLDLMMDIVRPMDEEIKNKKLREAERLRTRSVFPFNLFSSPDYEGSAEIFCEVGNGEDDFELKVKYYEEAARTYEMCDGEYGRYQASQMYERIGQMSEEQDWKRSSDAYKRSGMYSKQCGRESLAASSFQKAADMLRKGNELNGSLECLKKVVECYHGSNWKHHKIKAMKDVAGVYIDLGRYGEASKVFLSFKENMYTFCAFLCHVIEGLPSDLDVSGDEKGVCDALERDMSVAYNVIDEYIATHAMIEEVRRLLLTVKERLRPENDIL